MLQKFEHWLLAIIDRCYGLERLALRAGLSAEDARRVAHYEP
jgi:hypothetical protein